MPAFSRPLSRLTGSYSTPGNPRIEIPVSGREAIKDYYLCCAEKGREKLALLLPYGSADT